jgi:very-short-patch-repair endonuclease
MSVNVNIKIHVKNYVYVTIISSEPLIKAQIRLLHEKFEKFAIKLICEKLLFSFVFFFQDVMNSFFLDFLSTTFKR